MLSSFKLQRFYWIIHVIDVNIHVIAARSEKPTLMRWKSDFFWWISMMRQNCKRFSQVSQIPKSDGFISWSSCYLLIVFIKIQGQYFTLRQVISTSWALWAEILGLGKVWSHNLRRPSPPHEAKTFYEVGCHCTWLQFFTWAGREKLSFPFYVLPTWRTPLIQPATKRGFLYAH